MAKTQTKISGIAESRLVEIIKRIVVCRCDAENYFVRLRLARTTWGLWMTMTRHFVLKAILGSTSILLMAPAGCHTSRGKHNDETTTPVSPTPTSQPTGPTPGSTPPPSVPTADTPEEMQFATKPDGAKAFGLVYAAPDDTADPCYWLLTYTSTLQNNIISGLAGIIEWRVEDAKGAPLWEWSAIDKARLSVGQLRIDACSAVKPIVASLKASNILFSRRGEDGVRHLLYKISFSNVCRDLKSYIKNLEDSAHTACD